MARKTAFDWGKYESRTGILMSMNGNIAHCDTLMTTEDGFEYPVSSVVMSVLGDCFTKLMYEQIDDINNKPISWEGCTGGKELKKVKVDKIDSKSMKALIDSCYSGRLELTHVTVWTVLEAAEIYKMKYIIDGCCEYLCTLVNRENCLEMYTVSKSKQNEMLLSKSLRTIRTNFMSVSKNKLFFSNISFDHFNTILSSDALNIESEELVWPAIKNWVTRDDKPRLIYLGQLLSHLRYMRTSISFLKELSLEPLILESKSSAVVNTWITSVQERAKQWPKKDGNKLPVGTTPIAVRPRIPSSILFAVGGWKTGNTCSLIETYDCITNQWFRSTNSDGPNRAYHGIEILENKLYVIGGTNGTEILASVHCYNPADGSWQQLNSLTSKRCYVATTILDGIIYAFGGHNGDFRMRTGEKYDPSLNEWAPIADMIIARSDASAATLNGLIYVVGGLNEASIEASVECYSPEKNEWTILARMQSARTSLAAVSFGGFLYALGGNSGHERLSSVERYDPDSNTWTLMPPMIGKRSTFKAAVIENKIFVAGGYNGHHPISASECFDIDRNSWFPISDLSAARSGLAVVSISNLPNVTEFTFYGNFTGR